jgi:hypothetical protein
VNVVIDVDQLYENWNHRDLRRMSCPCIGDLLGCRSVQEAGTPGDVATPEGLRLNKILIPRREVSRTIHNRSRKGTLALLELLARDVAAWPARAVEFYKLLGWTQHLNHLKPRRGRTVNLRDGDALDLIGSPFEEVAHTVDVRRVSAPVLRTGTAQYPECRAFVAAESLPGDALRQLRRRGRPQYFTGVLGNDSPYSPGRRSSRNHEYRRSTNVPAPIRRRALQRQLRDYYGDGKTWRSGQEAGAATPMMSLCPPT